MRPLSLALSLVLLAACGGSSGRAPVLTPGDARGVPPPPVHAQLQGTWQLVNFEAQAAARPASGQLTFDQHSNIVVHAELDPSQPGVQPPRTVFLDFIAKAAVDPRAGELNYIGLERRAPAEVMVPNATPPEAWKHYELSGDVLRLWVEDERGARIGILTFRKVP